MEITAENKCFGGRQIVATHASAATATDMTFGLYLPPTADAGPVPVLWFLSGLTCTHENAMVKSGAQAHAARHGLALVFPDTSPRGDGVANDEAYDLGQGAGFYLNATQAPWAEHFQMERYILDDLSDLIFAEFPLDRARQGITGHSMGGHGALTLAARSGDRFASVSAFSPICNPTASDWGQKQFQAYLGSVEAGRDHDATELVRAGKLTQPTLIDTGTDDQFGALLETETFVTAARESGVLAQIRMQPGYDHSYFFVSTFMGDHVEFHAQHLT